MARLFLLKETMFNTMLLSSTVIYDRSQGVTDVTEFYNNMNNVNANSTLLGIIVAACILFAMYAFLYVSTWYIDRNLNRSNVRLFKLITFGKSSADNVDSVSAVLYAGLILFIIILIISGTLNYIIGKIFTFIIGG